MDETPTLPGIYYCVPVAIVAVIVLIFSTGAGRAMGRLWDNSHLKAYALRIQKRITDGISHIRYG